MNTLYYGDNLNVMRKFICDEALLRPYEGEMESDQLPDTLEQIDRDQNRKY